MNALPSWIRASAEGDESPFVTARRVEARAALDAVGMPTKKTEAFRFTSVRDLVEADLVESDGDADVAAIQRQLGQDDTYRVVVGDGLPLVTGSTRDGVRVTTLADAMTTHAASIENTLARLVPATHFAAANTASFLDAIVVIVPAGIDAAVPVHLVHVVTELEKPAYAHARVVIIAEAGSRLTLVESYLGDRAGASFINSVVELRLGEAASVDHLVASEAPGSTVSTMGVSIGERARYAFRGVLLGGKLARFDHHVSLDADSASADLEGVLFARGTDHVDHHVHVSHRAAKGTSTQRFRGIADEHGTVVFDGIVNVHVGAPGCEVAQESKNLLLSRDAAVYAKPHLEIDVDEVVASHGTTVGSFDRDQLFYLRARGIDEAVARAMLTHAFVRTILDDIPVEPIRQRLTAALLARLPSGGLTEEEVAS